MRKNHIHCFIRKNTEELQDKLKKLGFIHNNLDENDRPWLALNYGMFISVDSGFERLNKDDIDCGENETLFLALAALNEHDDYMQWFYSTGWTTFDGKPLPDKWVLCDQRTLEHFGWVNNSPNSYKCDMWKKATPNELIEHFKHI